MTEEKNTNPIIKIASDITLARLGGQISELKVTDVLKEIQQIAIGLLKISNATPSIERVQALDFDSTTEDTPQYISDIPEIKQITPEESITSEHIICLVCGKKCLRLSGSHLKSHGLTKSAYKEKFGFPAHQRLEAKEIQRIAMEAITDENITCLICGTKRKNLKRHLSTEHELTVAKYKQMFRYPPGTSLFVKKKSASSQAEETAIDS